MAKTRVDIAKAGDYWGHWQGGYQLTVEDLQRMAANFTMEVVIDYEHASLDPDHYLAPAAGWVKSLSVEGDMLVGDVEWTEQAETMIDAGEKRYLSPVIDLYAVDPETGNPIGAKLLSVALTVAPFMEALGGVQNAAKGELVTLRSAARSFVVNARSWRANATKLGDLIRRLRDEKGLSRGELAGAMKGSGARDESTLGQIERGEIERPPDEVLESLAGALDTSVSRLKEALPREKQNTQNAERISAEDAMSSQLLSRLAGILGLSGQPDELGVLDETRQVVQNSTRVAELEKQIEDLTRERDELTGHVAQFETQQAQRQAADDEALINSAVADGKIAKSEEEDWKKRLRENRENTTAFLGSLKKGAASPNTQAEPPSTDPVTAMPTTKDGSLDRRTIRENARKAFKTQAP